MTLWDPQCLRDSFESASRAGDLTAIQQLMEEQLKLTFPGHDWIRRSIREMALKVAIENERLNVAEYLIEKGCRITEDVVYPAVKAGSFEALQWLLDHGWQPRGCQEQTKPSPLRYASIIVCISTDISRSL